ncbi:unnamed protein product [Caenorhabditis auriculariae]|uniref:Uncharacterized protein n=1 Tax=Caenorhabditis auriculariae TaxID=2777116 RepID=A0A8S1HW66_9PELO|nr:unnamed protein product [Caenorhabditis auriculariae]
MTRIRNQKNQDDKEEKTRKPPPAKRALSDANDSLCSEVDDQLEEIRSQLSQVLADNKDFKTFIAEHEQKMAVIVQQNTNLISQCSTLMARNDLLAAENARLQKELTDLQSTHKKKISFADVAAPRVPVELSHLATRVQLTREAASLKDKSLQAAVERLPDLKSDEQDKLDRELIEKICVAAKIQVPETTFRHECRNKRRPLKVRFLNTQDRDAFIRGFRIGLAGTYFTSDIPPRARRDMTETELTLLRQLRKKAYEDNLKAGVFKFYVREVQIVSTSEPRAFVVHSRGGKNT